jgi:predicted murein hydrolase (TIGR00659 family)
MTEQGLFALWVYLSASPLLGLTVTLVVYVAAYRLFQVLNGNPLANPVALSILLLMGFLRVTRTPYRVYFEGAQFVHFLLGPATVALAVPLYKQLATLRALGLPILTAVVVGVTVAATSAMGVAWLAGGSAETLLSLAPKSVTAPVAMGIAEKIGGVPSLTAVFVIITGILGAILGTAVLAVLRIRDDSVRGIAMGVAAHGIGTARAFQVSGTMGAFSGLAMALAALLTSIILPTLVDRLGWTP